MISVVHITSLTCNYISNAIDPYSSWIPWIDTFQIINNNCNLVIFHNISIFCGFKKVHSAYIEIFTVEIETNWDNIRLYSSEAPCITNEKTSACATS